MPLSIANIVKSIQDSALAKFKVTLHSGEQALVDCIYKATEAPSFCLMFPSGNIPEAAEPGKKCIVSIHSADEPCVLAATITKILDSRSLDLRAASSVDPVSLREYFRVMLSTTIIASFDPRSSKSSQDAWESRGMTVDLSGTGVLAVFPQEFENRNNIFIEIQLPNTHEPIQCVGHVVRMRKLRRERYQIALHFDHISRKNRDIIITTCLQEQRRQLRQRMESAEIP